MILCGWCGKPTANDDRCTACGHAEPRKPYEQRGREPITFGVAEAGRPALDPVVTRRRLDEARHALGPAATQAALAEYLDISTRTLGRWQKVAG